MKQANDLITVTAQVPTAVNDRLKQLADYHGRSKSQEVRQALAIHDAQSTLSYLQTPEAKAELGDELPDARAKVKADLAELIKVTYRRPPMPEPPFGCLN